MTDDERRAKNREKMRRWRAAHPERAAATNRRSYERKREQVAARGKRWFRENADRMREIKRQYFSDPEVLERHRAHCREGSCRWRRQNPERAKAHKVKYAALKRGATTGEAFSHEEIAERDGWRCHLCGGRVFRGNWSLDHLVPLSAGGEHSRINVALAHVRCNSARGNRGAAQLLLVG